MRGLHGVYHKSILEYKGHAPWYKTSCKMKQHCQRLLTGLSKPLFIEFGTKSTLVEGTVDPNIFGQELLPSYVYIYV